LRAFWLAFGNCAAGEMKLGKALKRRLRIPKTMTATLYGKYDHRLARSNRIGATRR
jgi:hypothetical protein